MGLLYRLEQCPALDCSRTSLVMCIGKLPAVFLALVMEPNSLKKDNSPLMFLFHTYDSPLISVN